MVRGLEGLARLGLRGCQQPEYGKAIRTGRGTENRRDVCIRPERSIEECLPVMGTVPATVTEVVAARLCAGRENLTK